MGRNNYIFWLDVINYQNYVFILWMEGKEMNVEMPVMTPEQIDAKVKRSIEYVKKLQIPAPQEKSRSTTFKSVTEKTPCATLNDKQVICFTEKLSPVLKSDVLNSVLLAQLVATKAFPLDSKTKKYDVVSWYGKYREVLEGIGWVTQGFSFTKHHVQGDSFEADKVLLELLGGMLTGPHIAIATSAINAIKQLSSKDSNASTIYRRNTQSDLQGNFGIGACSESNGSARLEFGVFYLSIEKKTNDILWTKYSSNNNSISIGTASVVLMPEIYDGVRADILRMLSGNAASFIADLDLGL